MVLKLQAAPLDLVLHSNFIGSGNTFAVNGTTVDISIAGGGGGGGGSASIGIGTTVGDAFSGIVTAGNLWYNTGEGRLFIYFKMLHLHNGLMLHHLTLVSSPHFKT